MYFSVFESEFNFDAFNYEEKFGKVFNSNYLSIVYLIILGETSFGPVVSEIS